MQELENKHIKLITETIDRSGISYSHLREDLIDHICCEIEAQLAGGVSFQQAFESIRHNIGIKSLQQVQEKTLLLIDKNYCAMKSTMKLSGIISTILLIVGTLFKIEHWPGGSIALALGFTALCLVFLPSSIYIMHRENKHRGTVLLYLTAFLGSASYFCGILFKVQHWPGANVLMTVGSLVLGFLFLPFLWNYLLKRAETGREKFVYSVGVVCAMLGFVGFLFKFMHWPGASLILFIDALLLAAVFIPFYTWVKYSKSAHTENSFIYAIAAVSWLSLTFLLLSLTTSKNIFEGFFTTQEKIAYQSNILKQKNESEYLEFTQAKNREALEKVKALTDDLDGYIQKLKMDILQQLEDVNSQAVQPDGVINIARIEDNTSTQATYLVMIGENGGGKASELKTKLDKTRTDFKELVNQDETMSKLIDACLGTGLPEGAPEWAGSWENLYFDHTSVMGCIEILTALQRNLHIAENEVISYLLNA